MRARFVSDPAKFLDRASPLLLADEARHNLILGLASTLRDNPSVYPEHRLWLVEEDDAVVGAALRTPPRGLVLARSVDGGALTLLVEAIDDDLPGLVGGLPEAKEFAALWAAKTGTRPDVAAAQGIYALEQVREAGGATGRARPATHDDLALLHDWWRAFAVEAMSDHDPDHDEIARAIAHRLDDHSGGFLLWEDGEVVSLAGFGNPTPNGVRIGPVYTPPERRGRGYATALVATLSTQCLAAGHRFCFLYTDLSNPTSNAIYRRIGYELVSESAEIRFVTTPEDIDR
jgi:GNAT superfamily N-acetyltransferase